MRWTTAVWHILIATSQDADYLKRLRFKMRWMTVVWQMLLATSYDTL